MFHTLKHFEAFSCGVKFKCGRVIDTAVGTSEMKIPITNLVMVLISEKQSALTPRSISLVFSQNKDFGVNAFHFFRVVLLVSCSLLFYLLIMVKLSLSNVCR